MKDFFIWLPRVISILFAGLIIIFALDSFLEKVPIVQKITGFLIHLLPALGVGGCLLIAWKYPLFGGLLFLLLGLVFSIFFGTYRTASLFVLTTAPLLIAGGLFMFSHLFLEGKTSTK